MKPHDNDRLLKRAFQVRRSEHESRVPAFDPMWSRPSNPRPTDHATGVIAKKLALGLGLFVLIAILWRAVGVNETAEPEVEFQFSQWRAPTDFLLETPGRELLGGLPELRTTTAEEVLDSLGRIGREVGR